jgi:glycosyltransferase involved in cell wall biosynthesis
MNQIFESGGANIVLPERTGMPEWSAYAGFLDLVNSDAVAGLMHINAAEARRWAPVTQVRAVIAQPPLPDRFFDIGRERIQRSANGNDASLIFIGRLSWRKGFDRLMAIWPSWRLALSENGLVPRLLIYGRSFGEDIVQAGSTLSGSCIRWQENFPDEREMRLWPSTSVGVTLSRQEFDGIAVSELLACGVPVLASPTSGHRALAGESASVRIVRHEDDYMAEMTRLFAARNQFDHLRERAVSDMTQARSLTAVGSRLEGLLQEIG